MIAECLLATFRITGDDCPLAAASDAVGTRIDASPPLLRADGNVHLRFSSPADDGLTRVLDADARISYLHRSSAQGRDTYRCLSFDPCVVHDLIDAGFMAESLTYRRGTAVLTGAVVGHEVLQSVMATAGETVGITLERLSPMDGDDDSAVATQWDLTPAQTAALRQALAMGYFRVPREATAADVAAALDISTSAFNERLHRGQQALLSQVFDVGG